MVIKTPGRQWLGKITKVRIDRPLGSLHPKWNFYYPVNYGFVEGTVSGDDEEIDAYVLGVSDQILAEFEGRCIALIEREDDDDEKLIVVPDGLVLGEKDIRAQTDFQEKSFKIRIIMAPVLPPLIVIEGYDGSGKTTVASRLAEKLNGRYVKSYADSSGSLIWSHISKGDFPEADAAARYACRQKEAENQGAGCLVFDRHWLTICGLIPDELHQNWMPFPRTFLCCASLEDTVARLTLRGEKLETPHEVHLEQIMRFRTLADRYGVPILDTSGNSAEDCVQFVMTNL